MPRAFDAGKPIAGSEAARGEADNAVIANRIGEVAASETWGLFARGQVVDGESTDVAEGRRASVERMGHDGGDARKPAVPCGGQKETGAARNLNAVVPFLMGLPSAP